jgi:hypothetical protein
MLKCCRSSSSPIGHAGKTHISCRKNMDKHEAEVLASELAQSAQGQEHTSRECASISSCNAARQLFSLHLGALTIFPPRLE